MKIFTVILFFFLNSSFGIAQNIVFNNIYDKGDSTQNAGYEIIETIDGGSIIAGSYSGGGNGGAWIIKLNNTGDTVWTKSYNLSIGVDAAHSIIEVNNGYVFCGAYADTITNPSTTTAGAYLIRLNLQGDSLWTKKYQSMDADWVFNIVQTPDNGYVLAGYKIISPNFITRDAWVFKTDSLGNMLWQKQFDGHGLDDIFEKVIITLDGNIVCAGVTVLNAVTSKDYIVKLNQLGDTIWTKEFGGIECGGTLGINNTADGGFIGCGDICVNGRGRARAYKLDSLGNLIWAKDFARSSGDPSEIYNFVSIHEMHDGNFIAAGADYDLTQSQPGDAPRIRMMVMSANGDSLWSQQYDHSTGTDDDYLFDMKPTSDGGYIMCGYVIHSSPTNNDALVIKVDSIDCVNYVNGCQSVGIKAPHPPKGEFIVYPNPNNGNFIIETINIENATLEVYNVSGQLIQKTQITHKGKIDISEQPSSIYFVKVIQQNKVSMQKIIKN